MARVALAAFKWIVLLPIAVVLGIAYLCIVAIGNLWVTASSQYGRSTPSSGARRIADQKRGHPAS